MDDLVVRLGRNEEERVPDEWTPSPRRGTEREWTEVNGPVDERAGRHPRAFDPARGHRILAAPLQRARLDEQARSRVNGASS